MIAINQLIVDGESTADFPFEVFVTKNAGFVYAKKKNKLIETEYGTGAIKENINAWPPILKGYQLYCPTATLQDLRHVKIWAKDTGQLVASDEIDVYYEILDVTIEDAKIHEVSGYQLDITFTTQPFGFEHYPPTNTYLTGSTIDNDTNAPMYPRITIYGNSVNPTTVKIGEQEIYLKTLEERLIIECKPLEQTVIDSYGKEKNGVMGGDFFELKKQSQNLITLGTGITKIDILERWAWL